jgi:hypothetical protein
MIRDNIIKYKENLSIEDENVIQDLEILLSNFEYKIVPFQNYLGIQINGTWNDWLDIINQIINNNQDYSILYLINPMIM